MLTTKKAVPAAPNSREVAAQILGVPDQRIINGESVTTQALFECPGVKGDVPFQEAIVDLVVGFVDILSLKRSCVRQTDTDTARAKRSGEDQKDLLSIAFSKILMDPQVRLERNLVTWTATAARVLSTNGPFSENVKAFNRAVLLQRSDTSQSERLPTATLLRVVVGVVFQVQEQANGAKRVAGAIPNVTTAQAVEAHLRAVIHDILPDSKNPDVKESLDQFLSNLYKYDASTSNGYGFEGS